MSFRLKLVAYFLLVSLLPLGAAGWGLHAVVRQSETRRVDVRLDAGLRAVLAGYKDELSIAAGRANRLAKSTRFQHALQRHDRRALQRLVADSPGLQLKSRTRTLAASPVRGSSKTALALLSPQDHIDDAVTSADRRLLLGLFVSMGLIALVAYIVGGSIVNSLAGLADAANAIARGRLDRRVEVRGRDEFARLSLAFNQMTDQLEERVEELGAERARLRDATVRFGEALAATHDVDQLLRVIVETVVETTGATGGLVVGLAGEVVQSGTLSDQGERFELPLTAGRQSFGTLSLSGRGFTVEQRRNAASLVAHAAIALENARLHRIVARQALVDMLTGLANRRHCEGALASELLRAERFGGSVAFVLADLDSFKSINDRYGHPVGDGVLIEFAETLRECVREIDLPTRRVS